LKSGKQTQTLSKTFFFYNSKKKKEKTKKFPGRKSLFYYFIFLIFISVDKYKLFDPLFQEKLPQKIKINHTKLISLFFLLKSSLTMQT